MKKILSIILALALCLSFAACGNNTATDSTDAGSISENSSASVSEESSLEAESSEETSELTSDTDSGVYEVTVDNWQDYLEFGYDVMVDYEDDGVTVEDITLYPSIFVKDGYKIAKGDEKVELAFDAKYEWRYVFINKEDFTYEIGGICEGHDPYKDTVLDTFLGYHEEFDDPDYPEVHSSWLQAPLQQLQATPNIQAISP
ncbi:MAG: hypothetical protein J6M16_06600 [Clostridia bacterium]|nr:hypothetical protein [Clostridia bacterium]